MALDLTATALEALRPSRPAPAPGLRIPPDDQTHLTLHFLGGMDLTRADAALAPISLPPMALDLDGVGTFRSSAGAVTLWAGVRTSPDLLRIHSAVAEALAPLGFRPESRPYTPHITLGRYETGASEEAVNAFLARSCPRGLGSVESFSLFSSAFEDGAPVYRRERVYRLAPVIRDS